MTNLSDLAPGILFVRETRDHANSAFDKANTGNSFSDTTFTIQDDADLTKQIAFQASGITTGTTRTITMADEDVDLGNLGGSAYVRKTTTYTAVAKDLLSADTSGGAFTITLPLSPSEGDVVTITDADGSWATNNLTIGRNSESIGGAAEDFVCNVNGLRVEFAYTDGEWRVTASGGIVTTTVYDADLATFTLPASTTITTAAKTALGLSNVSTGDILYASSANTWTQLAAGTDDQVLTLASGTPSWAADAAVGQQTIWMPAGAMVSRSSNGAESVTSNTSTHLITSTTFDFDTAADEYVQWAIQMPKSWDESTLVTQAVWSHANTVTPFGVTWFVQATALGNADILDTAFGTAVSMTDTGGTNNAIYITPESTAITVAGSPAAEEYVVFQMYRDVSDASDDLAVDAKLHGVKIHYTVNTGNDG